MMKDWDFRVRESSFEDDSSILSFFLSKSRPLTFKCVVIYILMIFGVLLKKVLVLV